jgi:hypothetical protein
VFDPRQQPPPAVGLPHDALGGRQALGVLLEPLHAEELGADRVFRRLPGYAHTAFAPGVDGGRVVFGIPKRRNQRKCAVMLSRNDPCSV